MKINKGAVDPDEPYILYDQVDESHIIDINNRLDKISKDIDFINSDISDVRSEVNPPYGVKLGEKIIEIDNKIQDIQNVIYEITKTVEALCEHVSRTNLEISNAEDRIKFLVKIPVVAFLIVLGIIVYAVLKH